MTVTCDGHAGTLERERERENQPTTVRTFPTREGGPVGWKINKGTTMETRTDQLRNLAKVIHDIRPDWHTNGIIRVLEQDSRPVDELRAIAIAAASDMTARGPGVIATRDEPAPVLAPRPSSAQPPNVADILRAPKQSDDVAHRGAALARAEIRKWKEADEW